MYFKYKYKDKNCITFPLTPKVVRLKKPDMLKDKVMYKIKYVKNY